MRQTALTLLLSLAAACGGGGSSGPGSVSIASVTPSSLALHGIAGMPAPRMHWRLTFSGDVDSLAGRTVYIGVTIPEPAYFVPTFSIDQDQRTLDIDVEAVFDEPAETTYTGAAQIYLCYDVSCTSQLGNSPWSVPYTIDVAPGIRFSPATLEIEVPFGEVPAPRQVEVLLPEGTAGAYFGATSSPFLQIYGTLSGTAYEVIPLAAPAGTYTASCDVEASVPNPSVPGMGAQVRASLPITYRVLPDPARPFVVTPASSRFDFKLEVLGSQYQDSRSLSLLQQVVGGWMELAEAVYTAAPPEAAGHPLAEAWLSWPAGSRSSFDASACTGSPAYDCLPPGTYQAAVRVRYHAADGALSELDVPVEMVIDPCCGATCVDLASSVTSCGACFHACDPGYACNAGRCECGGGKAVCSGSCVDPQTDARHCGSCGNLCLGAQVCVDGSCCPGGQTACGAACADLRSDQQHCGTCGNACRLPERCLDGQCGCPGGGSVCGSECRDLLNDPLHCGTCDTACNPEQTCTAGSCACPPGESVCGLGCVDLQADPTSCGACGTTCVNGEACLAGQCACPPGSQACGGGACVDLATDAWHCGACDAACPAGQTCAGGGCLADASAFRMVGVGPGHSGVNAGETGVPPLTLAWVAPGLGTTRQVVLEGGRVVTDADLGRALVALEASSGSELWRHEEAASIRFSWPAASDGRVYRHRVDGAELSHLDVLDLGTGQVVDGVTFASQWQTYWSPLVVGDAVFLGGGMYGGLRGYDLAPSLAERFFADLPSEDPWAPAWSGGLVYTFLDGTLRAHDPLTGAAAASRALPSAAAGSGSYTAPVFGDALGYVVSQDLAGTGTLHAFQPGTLEPAWAATERYRAYPAVAGDEVYALTLIDTFSSGRLRALDALTGEVRWSFDGDGSLLYPPVIAAGHLYVASDANVYALDLASREQVWTAPVGGRLAVGSGMLLVSQYTTGKLFAFRLTR